MLETVPEHFFFHPHKWSYWASLGEDIHIQIQDWRRVCQVFDGFWMAAVRVGMGWWWWLSGIRNRWEYEMNHHHLDRFVVEMLQRSFHFFGEVCSCIAGRGRRRINHGKSLNKFSPWAELSWVSHFPSMKVLPPCSFLPRVVVVVLCPLSIQGGCSCYNPSVGRGHHMIAPLHITTNKHTFATLLNVS